MWVNNLVSPHLKYTMHKRLILTDMGFVCEKTALYKTEILVVRDCLYRKN